MASARSVSIRVIEPLTNPWASMKASGAWAMMSTSALPMPTTSNRAWFRALGTAGHATGLTVAHPAVTLGQVTQNPYRLPRSAHPIRYQVTLEPDLGTATFGGQVDIALAINEPITELVLNAIELDIRRVTVDGAEAAFHLDEAT